MIPDEPGIFRQCVENIGRLRHACDRYAMPLMIEPLVMAPADRAPPTDRWVTWKIVSLVRLARELGADIIKGRSDRSGGGFSPRGGSGAQPDAGAWRRQGSWGRCWKNPPR